MKKTTKTIQIIKEHAINNQIPIIHDEVVSILTYVIQNFNIKKILEIGTATSYSAHIMASAGAHVWSIERHDERFSIAQQFVSKSEYKDDIQLIYADALTHEIEIRDFDLIFIDAAKSQYIQFFEKYKHNLDSNGMIVVDNLNFHHLDPSKVKRHTRQLLKKLEKFKLFLASNEDFITTILPYGDGLSFSYKQYGLYANLKNVLDKFMNNEVMTK